VKVPRKFGKTSEDIGSGRKACESQEGVWKSKYGKRKQATSVGRAWKSVEDGGSQIGSVERVGRVLGEARASAEEEARLGRGKASCGRPNMGAEGCGSAMEMQAAFRKWSEDCGRESE
jgi:hypothetical protein